MARKKHRDPRVWQKAVDRAADIPSPQHAVVFMSHTHDFTGLWAALL